MCLRGSSGIIFIAGSIKMKTVRTYSLAVYVTEMKKLSISIKQLFMMI